MQYSKNIAIFEMSSNFRLYRGNVFQSNTPMLLIIYPCSTGGSIHKIDRRIRSPFFHRRFVSMMPTPVLFTVFSFLLRVVDGTGTAMFMAVSYTLLTQSYPEKKGTIVVSDLPWDPTIGGHHWESTVCFLKLLSTMWSCCQSYPCCALCMSNSGNLMIWEKMGKACSSMQFINSCMFLQFTKKFISIVMWGSISGTTRYWMCNEIEGSYNKTIVATYTRRDIYHWFVAIANVTRAAHS